jgi:nucleoside-diphosphate-sugar epimerase
MKIFLTGGTGFIGSHFLNQALAAGHQVRCLRRSSQSKPRIKLREEPEWLDLPLDKIEPRHLEGTDVLVHLAAAGVDPRDATWENCFKVNVTDSLNLWLKAVEAGVKKFVICGSCFEYGRAGERYDCIPPNAPLEPTGAYHSSKAAATMAALGLAVDKKLKCSILRPFHVFGEGEAENRLWPSLRKAALAGEDFPMTLGEQIRDFIPVEAVAARFLDEAVRMAELQVTSDGCRVASGKGPKAQVGGQRSEIGNSQLIRVANVGTGHPQTLRQFAEFWWEKWEAKGELKLGAVPYRDNEVMRYVPKID